MVYDGELERLCRNSTGEDGSISRARQLSAAVLGQGRVNRVNIDSFARQTTSNKWMNLMTLLVFTDVERKGQQEKKKTVWRVHIRQGRERTRRRATETTEWRTVLLLLDKLGNTGWTAKGKGQ